MRETWRNFEFSHSFVVHNNFYSIFRVLFINWLLKCCFFFSSIVLLSNETVLLGKCIDHLSMIWLFYVDNFKTGKKRNAGIPADFPSSIVEFFFSFFKKETDLIVIRVREGGFINTFIPNKSKSVTRNSSSENNKSTLGNSVKAQKVRMQKRSQMNRNFEYSHQCWCFSEMIKKAINRISIIINIWVIWCVCVRAHSNTYKLIFWQEILQNYSHQTIYRKNPWAGKHFWMSFHEIIFNYRIMASNKVCVLIIRELYRIFAGTLCWQ